MAGSITVTTSEVGNAVSGRMTKYSVAWVSSAGGAVSGNSFNVRAGHLHQVKYFPDGGGTQPTDQYDMTIADADGFDVLTGTGANLSNAAAKASVPQLGDGTTASNRAFLEAGALTPSISNAGNAKGGTVVLIVGP